MINKDRAKSLMIIALIIGICVFAAGVSGRIIMGRITHEIMETEYIHGINNSIPGFTDVLNRGVGNLNVKLVVSLIKNDSSGFVNAVGDVGKSIGELGEYSLNTGFVSGLRVIAEMAFQETRDEMVKMAGVYMPMLQFAAYYHELMIIGGIIAAIAFVLLFLMGGKITISKYMKTAIIIGIVWIVLLAVLTIMMTSKVKDSIVGESQSIQTSVPSDVIQDNIIEQEKTESQTIQTSIPVDQSITVEDNSIEQEQLESSHVEQQGQNIKMTIEEEDIAMHQVSFGYNSEIYWDVLKSNEVVLREFYPSTSESEKGYKEVVIPDHIDTFPVIGIRDGACWNVSFYLTKIEIPYSIRIIEDNPFYRCEKLSEIKISGDSEYIATIDGVLFSKKDKRLICYPCALSMKEYTIPKGIVLIGDRALAFCNNLERVIIPDSVKSIGEWAFLACASLKSINIPDSVSYIGERAFEDCENLTITVARNSYAEEYCRKNNLKYICTDNNDWLMDDYKGFEETITEMNPTEKLAKTIPAEAAIPADDWGEAIEVADREGPYHAIDALNIGDTIHCDDCEVTLFDAGWAERFGRASGGFGIYTAAYTAEKGKIYYCMCVRVRNLMKEKHNFRNDFKDVICRYGEGYTFPGLVEEWSEAGDGLTMARGKGISTDVDPLDEGKYYIAVSLPEYVQNNLDKYLQIEFSIGEHNFVYFVSRGE